jgi:hypothetical protein
MRPIVHRHCMVLVFAAFVLSTLAASTPARADDGAAATKENYNHVPVSLWLFPHVGTGGFGGRTETNLALSLGVSGYARLRGLDLGIGGSLITESMTGAQGTVGFNYVGADTRGAQLTVGGNLTRGDLVGLQSSVGFNYVGGAMHGVQLSVGGNLAPGQAHGMQAAVGYNHAAQIHGAQVGIINYGGAVSGAQIGLLNIAGKVSGTQIGLLNIAEDSDASLGLLSLVKNGQHHFELWSSDTTPFNVGFKLGSKHVYTLLAAGFTPRAESKRWMAGLGVGGHIPVTERFYVDADLVTWHVNKDEAWTRGLNSLNKLRLIGGYRMADNFSLFAGATLNVLVSRVDDGSDFGLFDGTRVSNDGAETTVRVWPGFLAGLRI